MIKNEWQRFYSYEKILLYSLAALLILLAVNEEIRLIPFEISGYFFWLSLGLYLGFRLAKWEIIRVQKNQAIDDKERRNNFTNN